MIFPNKTSLWLALLLLPSTNNAFVPAHFHRRLASTRLQMTPVHIATPDEVLAFFAQPDAVILDVRSQGEIDTQGLIQTYGRPWVQTSCTAMECPCLPGAAHTMFPHKNIPIIVHCSTGGRAARAKEVLEQMGYRRVVNAGAFDDLQYLQHAADKHQGPPQAASNFITTNMNSPLEPGDLFIETSNKGGGASHDSYNEIMEPMIGGDVTKPTKQSRVIDAETVSTERKHDHPKPDRESRAKSDASKSTEPFPHQSSSASQEQTSFQSQSHSFDRTAEVKRNDRPEISNPIRSLHDIDSEPSSAERRTPTKKYYDAMPSYSNGRRPVMDSKNAMPNPINALNDFSQETPFPSCSQSNVDSTSRQSSHSIQEDILSSDNFLGGDTSTSRSYSTRKQNRPPANGWDDIDPTVFPVGAYVGNTHIPKSHAPRQPDNEAKDPTSLKNGHRDGIRIDPSEFSVHASSNSDYFHYGAQNAAPYNGWEDIDSFRDPTTYRAGAPSSYSWDADPYQSTQNHAYINAPVDHTASFEEHNSHGPAVDYNQAVATRKASGVNAPDDIDRFFTSSAPDYLAHSEWTETKENNIKDRGWDSFSY